MTTPDAVMAHLTGMGTLGPDWDGYGAKPTTMEAVTAALELAGWLESNGIHTVPGNWSPSANGGIYFEAYEGNRDLIMLDIHTDGSHLLRPAVTGVHPEPWTQIQVDEAQRRAAELAEVLKDEDDQ